MKSTQAEGNPDLNWVTLLHARPIRNAAANIEAEENELLIEVRNKKSKWLVPPLSWLIRPAPYRRVRLSGLGKDIWEWCDGENTVETVVESFARRHGFSFHEARAAVTGYLHMLVGRGVIALALSRKTGG